MPSQPESGGRSHTLATIGPSLGLSLMCVASQAKQPGGFWPFASSLASLGWIRRNHELFKIYGDFGNLALGSGDRICPGFGWRQCKRRGRRLWLF
jgi:hypothetical protein